MSDLPGHMKMCASACWSSHLALGVQDAKAQLQQVLSRDPSSGHAWHTLGQMAEETGDLPEAAHCYTEGTHSTGHHSLLCSSPSLPPNMRCGRCHLMQSQPVFKTSSMMRCCVRLQCSTESIHIAGGASDQGGGACCLHVKQL